MCAQRKQAVKAPRRAAPASAPATESKLAKTPAPSSKAPAAQKNQEKAPGFIKRISERVSSLIRDTRSEIKKITWPDRETTRKLTLLVLGVSVVLGLALGGIDFVLLRLFEAI